MSDTPIDTSKFFFELTPDKILDAVESIGVRCTGRCLQLNSLENRVFEVEIELNTEAKSKYDSYRVVKFYRPGRWSKEQILEEHQFLAEANEAELPVVCPVSLPNGETIGTVPNTALLFSVFPKVGGRLKDEPEKQDLERLGRFLGRLHSLGVNRTESKRPKLTPQAWGLANADFLAQSKIIPGTFESRYLPLVKEICTTSAPWFEASKVQRIHGDFHCGNVLWLNDQCTVIDFDDVVVAPPVQDVWLITPGRGPEADAQRDALLSGYEQFYEFDWDTLRLVEPLRALRMIHFSAWIAKRWEDPAFKRVFLDFGSERYWGEQIVALMEVLETMHGVRY